MPTPYPDKDFTQHEQWAEAEAKFCEQMVETLNKAAQGYAEKALAALKLPYESQQVGAQYSTVDANRCAIMMGVWNEMAGQLRKPRIARIENEGRY
jgi:hypothetical protein